MELWMAAKLQPTIWGKIGLFFGKPEDLNPTFRGELEATLLPPPNKVNHSDTLKKYIPIQLILTCILLIVLTLVISYISAVLITLIITLILLTLINCGALLQQLKWVFHLEDLRLIVIGLFTILATGNWLIVSWIILLPILLWFLESPKRYYYEVIYSK